MARALSNRNVCDATFEAAPFEGEWLASLGRPELRGSWIIFGASGTGKTHFALLLLKYLSRFVDKVAYNTVEQGMSLSFQRAWLDAGMADAGSRVVVLDREQIPELRERLRKRKSPRIVVIDSITALSGFTRSAYAGLVTEFPDRLFIFLAHERGGNPYPTIAEHVRKLSEIKIRTEGFKAYVNSRFSGADCGGEPFVIWPEGAARYYAEIE